MSAQYQVDNLAVGREDQTESERTFTLQPQSSVSKHSNHIALRSEPGWWCPSAWYSCNLTSSWRGPFSHCTVTLAVYTFSGSLGWSNKWILTPWFFKDQLTPPTKPHSSYVINSSPFAINRPSLLSTTESKMSLWSSFIPPQSPQIPLIEYSGAHNPLSAPMCPRPLCRSHAFWPWTPTPTPWLAL